MSQYSNLVPHLADAGRRKQLLGIEQQLSEHAFPPQMVVENTSVCNLRCIHCSHKELIRPQRHMDRALWDKIVEEIGRESPDTEIWPTFYGEAMILGAELWNRLHHAAESGCRNLVLNSNGTLLTRGGAIEEILRSPLRRFILSLDGFSPAVFENVRRKAKWSEVYPAVAELCRRSRERGKPYPVITVQFSLMKENAAEAESFRDYWRKLGAEVKLRPMLEWTAQGSVRTETITHGSDFRIACPWANNTMAVLQDGRVTACAVDYEGSLAVANLRDHTIREAWEKLGDVLRAPQREHRWNDLPKVCQGCGDWQVAGAEYEKETVSGTRPFWYYERQASADRPDAG